MKQTVRDRGGWRRYGLRRSEDDDIIGRNHSNVHSNSTLCNDTKEKIGRMSGVHRFFSDG